MNVEKGIKRIVWIVSVIGALIAIIGLFSLSPLYAVLIGIGWFIIVWGVFFLGRWIVGGFLYSRTTHVAAEGAPSVGRPSNVPFSVPVSGIYCWKCGLQNPKQATFCNRCGSKLREPSPLEANTQPASSPAPHEVASPSSSIESHSQVEAPAIEPPSKAFEPVFATGASIGPTGVGGWLGLFCFGLTVLAPLAAIGYFLDSLATSPDLTAIGMADVPGLVIALNAVFYFGLAAYSLITGIRVWILKPNAIRQAKIFLIVSLVVGLISLAIYAATTQTSDAATASGITRFLGVVGSFVIWWTYLTTSKRVRNTFVHVSIRRQR